MTKRSPPARPHFWLRPAFWRWFARLLVAGILLVMAGAVWVLVYPPALNPVRDELQSWLSQRLERDVRFQQLTWTWDRGLTVRARQVRVGEDGLAAAEVRLGVAALPLLRGELDLQRLELRGLRLPVTRGPEGRMSAGGFRLDPERNRVFPLLARFSEFRIRDGRLRWQDRSGPRPVRLVLADWQLDVERGARHHLVDLTGRVGKGTVAVHGGIEDFAGGPQGWRLNVQARGQGLAPSLVAGYAGDRWPAAVPGPLSLWAEVVGGLGDRLEAQGHLEVAAGELRWPDRLRRPLPGAGGRASFRYRGQDGDHRLRLQEARLAAAGLTVTGEGQLRWGPALDGPRVEADVALGATPVRALEPLTAIRALPTPVADWLRRALVAGRVESARAEIAGPVAAFPYPQGGGTFRVTAHVADLRLAYHPAWPPLTGLSGSLSIDRRRLTLRGEQGQVVRARLVEADASIHDLAGDPPRLRLRGDLALQLVDGVRFLERSPLQPRGFLEPAALVGPAKLHLGLDLPLTKGAKPRVFGRVDLDGAAFRPRPGVPALVGVTGQVAFQGGRIHGRELRGRLLGQPVALGLDRQADGPFRVEVAGTFPAEALRTALARHGPGHPLARRLTGKIAARLGVVWGREERRAELRADLEGAALILPEPAFNGIGDPGELALRWQPAPVPRLTGTLDTGRGQWRVLASRPRQAWRLGLSLGLGQPAPAAEPGVGRVMGSLPRLPLGEWADLVRTLAPERLGHAGGLSLPRLEADVTAGTLAWRDSDLGGGRVVLNGRSEHDAYVLTTDLQGERAAGRLEWKRLADRRNDLRVRLERLILPAPGDWTRPEGLTPLRARGAGLALDLLLQADRIELGRRTLKGTRLQAQLFPDRWLLHGLRTRLGDSDLRLEGSWRAPDRRTQLRVALDTEDFGGLLRDAGVYPSMKEGRGSLRGTLWWPGRPAAFALDRLGGDLELHMVEGEIEEFFFLSKALTTLNVLDWPLQVARGFKDMAHSGLVYRELKGRVRLADGVARTRDWSLESAPLRLSADGTVDLGSRTYDLLFRVQPLQTVDKVVSAVPILGYLLTGDSRTIMALDYRVRGPWAAPVVTATTEDERENPVETLFRRLREMQWEDIVPWR